MQEDIGREKIKKWARLGVILVLCAVTLALDYVEISLLDDKFRDTMLRKCLQQTCGAVAAILLMRYLQICLFGRIRNALYLLPCLLVAVNNMQWSALFSGEMQMVRNSFWDILLFGLSSFAVGLFEELIFRGVLFSVLAGLFSNDKKGFLLTYVVSSVVFGLSHLFNGFSLATVLQVGYTTLTGGLFAFCLLKTKNIFCPALVHGVYNFCGTFFAVEGLGAGVVFDLGTVLSMAIIGVFVGIFVLYKVWTYPANEREELYRLLDAHQRKEGE